MYSLDQFFAEQAWLETRFADFLASLDRRRTATLRELIVDEAAPVRIKASWLDCRRLAERFAAMCRFFDRVDSSSRTPKERQPLFFFQSNCEKEDAEAHARFHQPDGPFEDYYRARVGDAPSQHNYLHTDIGWTDLMLGTWESGNRVIHPLLGFASREWPTVLHEDPVE